MLQHCGLFPFSVAKDKPAIGYPLAFDSPGAVEAEAKGGELTLCRFDGDNGEYSLLLGKARGIEGPYTKGTYLWIEVDNLKRLEEKSFQDHIFIMLVVSMQMWSLFFMKHANTLA